MESRFIKCQERYAFMENPKAFLEERLSSMTQDQIDNIRKKRLLETRKHYNAFKERKVKEIKDNESKLKKDISAIIKKYTASAFIYFKGNKIQIPNDFYITYKEADAEGYLNYLIEEEARLNIVTDEDREKARLLNCDVNYTYLQTLINKMTNVPDLVVTIKHKDGQTVVLRRIGQEEADNDLINNELTIEPLMVK